MTGTRPASGDQCAGPGRSSHNRGNELLADVPITLSTFRDHLKRLGMSSPNLNSRKPPQQAHTPWSRYDRRSGGRWPRMAIDGRIRQVLVAFMTSAAASRIRGRGKQRAPRHRGRGFVARAGEPLPFTISVWPCNPNPHACRTRDHQTSKARAVASTAVSTMKKRSFG